MGRRKFRFIRILYEEFKNKNSNLCSYNKIWKKNNTHKELLKHVQSKKGFLGIVHERENLNKKITGNDEFDMIQDYINEYKEALSKFFNMYEKYIKKVVHNPNNLEIKELYYENRIK